MSNTTALQDMGRMLVEEHPSHEEEITNARKLHKEEMEKHLLLTSSQLTTSIKHIDTVMNALNPLIPLAKSFCKDTHSASAMLAAQWSLNSVARNAMMISGDQVCPVVVRVGQIHKKKCKFCLDSAFYSHDKGYKMCLCVYPAGKGSGKGTHLSVYLVLMKGLHDDELTWPLRGKFEVKLLNQISDCEHHSCTMVYDNSTPDSHASRVTDGDRSRSWGKSQFISNEDLHKVSPTCQYSKDCCIFLQVSKV